jgi:hypothetical protein
MDNAESATTIQKLDSLIERVEAHISEQCARMLVSDVPEHDDEETLADMLVTLEQLHAFRERFYATVH